jgi:hypothetical protein
MSEELVADEDWEEKYSEQHKRKFWKNKKTGKSSWTEPPKVSKAATTKAAGESSKKPSPTEESSATELVPPLQQTHQLSRATNGMISMSDLFPFKHLSWSLHKAVAIKIFNS